MSRSPLSLMTGAALIAGLALLAACGAPEPVPVTRSTTTTERITTTPAPPMMMAPAQSTTTTTEIHRP
jgi:hypothetical protein